jgi:glycosyltransferase involved in cell wall biosynthesis
MKVAIVAPSAVPFRIGGAENLWWGLLHHFNQHTSHQADLIKIPSREGSFWELIDNYWNFSQLDLSHFDVVISTKYPAWMVNHPNHVCFLQHKLRGLYDQCPPSCLNSYITANAELADLQRFMQRNQGQRAALPEFYDRIHHIRAHRDRLPSSAFQFPGQLIREILYFLDGIGLAPSAIKKYAAISHNVANRSDYFPASAAVDVFYHPPMLNEFYQGRYEYLFTVSRLEQGSKRIGLLIEAMKHVKANIQFKIAGTGDDVPRLKQLAGDDPRIEFLGFVNDQGLARLYADAFAVLYIPYDEDYGLITVEAMMSGKPVITATDSGGTNEFVRNGETGYAVAPDPLAIAERIDALCANPKRAQQMGQTALEQVKGITWDNAIARLLDKTDLSPRQSPRQSPQPTRKKIAVAVTYPVFPPRGGGTARIFHLYRHLAQTFDIELVTFTEQPQPFSGKIAPGLWETRIPMSAQHLEAEAAIRARVEVLQISDVVMPQLYHLTPDYTKALQQAIDSADSVVACRPYLLPLIREITDKPVWYETHDVEVDVKRKIYPQQGAGSELLQTVQRVERDACHYSQLVMVCSNNDAARLQELYQVDRQKFVEVPNGVDLESVNYASLESRYLKKQELGLRETFTALFLGSWHKPNVDAVRAVVDMAIALPDVTFLVMGNVGFAFSTHTPPNDDDFLQKTQSWSHDRIVQDAYRSYLGRDVDDGAKDHYVWLLNAKKISRSDFLTEIKTSLEFIEKVESSIDIPPNFSFIGEVDDHTKDVFLGIVDVALNPVLTGSGTNIKMLDYFAAGVPVLSTPFGVRGLGLEHQKHCWIAELDEFTEAIRMLQQEDMVSKQARVDTARQYVEEKFDWRAIANNLLTYIHHIME